MADNLIWSYTGISDSIRTDGGGLDTLALFYFGLNVTAGNASVAGINACGTGSSAILPITVNTLQPTPAGTAGGPSICATYYVLPAGTVYTDPATCHSIGSVTPSGANPVAYNIMACITVDASVQTYNGIPYVQRHYNIEPGINAGSSTATLTLYFTQADFDAYNLARGSNPALPGGPADATGIANLRITQFHGNGTTPGTFVGSSSEIDPADNNIVWNTTAGRWEITFDITGFSGFFVSSGSLVPLPLTLVSFTAQATTGGVLLGWTTSSEQNTSTFELQRSSDGKNFQSLATIPAAENSNSPRNYSYTDLITGIIPPAFWYRLKMEDLDGKYTYSRVAVVQSAGSELAMTLLPNPFHDQFNATITSPRPANAVITITDLSGRLLQKQNVSLKKGANSLETASIAQLPAGMYFMTLTTTDAAQQTIRFVKE